MIFRIPGLRSSAKARFVIRHINYMYLLYTNAASPT